MTALPRQTIRAHAFGLLVVAALLAGACSPTPPALPHSPLYQDVKLKSDQDETVGVILVAPNTSNETLSAVSRDLLDRFISSRDLSIIIYDDAGAAAQAVALMNSGGKVADQRKSPHSVGLATNRGVLQPDVDVFIPPAVPTAKMDR